MSSTKSKISQNSAKGGYWPSRLKYGWMPPHTALYVTRAVYEKARLANGQYFDTSFTRAADYDFMMRILVKLKIHPAYLPRVLVKMRVGGVSNRSIRNLFWKSREDYRAIRRNYIGGFNTLLAKNFRKLPQFFNPNRGMNQSNRIIDLTGLAS